MRHIETGFIKRTTLIVLFCVGLVLAGLVMLLPRGFSDDLSLVGTGSGSVVLVNDKNLVAGQTTMELLNKIRSDYEPSIHFIVVDIATPTGQEFVRIQNAGVISLSFFGSDGRRVNLLESGVTEQKVRAVLNRMLSN